MKSVSRKAAKAQSLSELGKGEFIQCHARRRITIQLGIPAHRFSNPILDPAAAKQTENAKRSKKRGGGRRA